MTTSVQKYTGFVEITNDYERRDGGQRWIRRIDPTCWISVLYRLTGFGWREWETALMFLIEPGSQDCLIISGDRRQELLTMPKEFLRPWYAANIDGNRNSFDTLLEQWR